MAKSKGGTGAVELGFLEESDSLQLRSHFFPSKFGGKPAWLSLSPLPKNLPCDNWQCNKPMVFLIQIYAPINKQLDCFHRTIFCFVCREPSCCLKNKTGNFRVLRSQLPRENKFYSFDPPSENSSASDGPSACDYQELCVVCGVVGPKRCARCHKTSYCGKEHQTVDWKTVHKKMCNAQGPEVQLDVDYPNILFPEHEIVTESEEIQDSLDRSDAEKLKDYGEFLKSDEAKNVLKGTPAADLEAMASKEKEKDKIFLNFKKRIAKHPDQILRYDREGTPLLVSDEHIPRAEDIPKCSCGAKRSFEFQIMPQLLNYMGVDQVGDSIDWGTLCVYTCSNSCHIGNQYQEEFIWKQDFKDE